MRDLWNLYLGRTFGSIKILDRYIMMELLRPFFVCLLFFIVLFLSISLRDILGEFLAKGIDLRLVLFFFFSISIEQLPYILPLVTLFASTLAVRRLSNDNELTAMRSAGMGYRRIYLSFMLLGFFLCFFMGFICFYFAPYSTQFRSKLASGLLSYQSLAFVRPGLFFNRPVWGGNHIDIYTKNRDSSTLREIYIHGWNIDFSQESKSFYYRGETRQVGRAQTRQIIFSKHGKLIKRLRNPSSLEKENKKEQKVKRNEDIEQKIEDSKLPEGLAGRELADLSFINGLAKIEDESAPKKYIRLEKGFMIRLAPDRRKIQVSNFLEGSLDYSLSSPPKGRGYFKIIPSTLTLGQLIIIQKKLSEGGLILDFDSIRGDKEFSPENYVEIPRKEVLPLLEKNTVSLSYLSPKEVQEKYGFYIPTKENTPEKRQAYFKEIYQLGSSILEKEIELLFLIQDRISLIPAIFLSLVLALPLGVASRRSRKGASFSIAFIIYVTYTVLSKLLELLLSRGEVGYIEAAWLPEIFLFAAFLLSLFRTQESRQLLSSLLYTRRSNKNAGPLLCKAFRSD